MSLIPTYAGRPSVLHIDGWTVYVSVRDAAYTHTKREWRHKLAAAHPDRGGSHDAFLATKRQFDRWRRGEAEWYQSLGLLPPDGWRADTIAGLPRQLLDRVEVTCGACGRTFRVNRCHATKARFCSRICARSAKGQPGQ